MWSPQVEQSEALKVELDYLRDCITQGKKPINDGQAGWRVVKMLEAANQSLKKRGEIVRLSNSDWSSTPTVADGRLANIARVGA